MNKSPKENKKSFTSRQWLVLATVMIASFLGRLDGTIVNLAIPHIITDFAITVSQAGWISTAYIIANAIFVPIFGKLGDLIGRKPLYLFGIIGFVLTSALAGLSFNLSSLIFFRVLQAITVSIDYPLALSILAFEFRDMDKRARAMGIWSAIFAGAQIFGPILGGPLIDNFSWRAVFYVNVPLGAIGTLMAWKFIREPVEKIKGVKNFDVLGSLLLGFSLGILVLVLEQGQDWGWISLKSLLSYMASLISLAVFILLEKNQKEPVLDLKFFKIQTFTISIIASFFSFMGMVGSIFLIPIFVQNFLGYSVTKSGYVFIPMAISILIAAQAGAKLSAKIPSRYVITAGMLWSTLAMCLFIGIDVSWTFWDIAERLALFAFGLGLGLAPLTRAATSTVPISEVGIASSVLALARNLSGAFGIAIFATILTNNTASSLNAIKQYSVINTLNPEMIKQAAYLISVKATILAYSNVFKLSVAIMAVGALVSLFIKEDRKKENLAAFAMGIGE
ncbi:multidrug efflux MFS transporter [Patescibacteria group bacterium]|nr:multidrug efflux MFS transporter [Patescibacteria group bacterium]